MTARALGISVIQISLVAAISYLGLLLFVYLYQGSLLYIPGDRVIHLTPADANLDYNEVELTTSDQVTVHGWYVPVADSRGVVLFCHGNAGNISHRLQSLQIFAQLGFSTFIFDYRGYGQSTGKSSESGTYRDSEAVYQYLVDDLGFKPEQIVLFGRSLGAAVAARLASRKKCAALVMESGFTSVPELGQQLYPILPVRLLSRFSYNSIAILKQLDIPILIAHSRDDEIIPFAHGKKLFDAANGPKYLFEMRGGHNDGFYVTGKAYLTGLDKFFAKVLR